MIRHYIFLLVPSSLILILTSCAKKCDDFNNKIIEWMPYKTNDKIVIFQKGNTDTLTVKYSEIYHTDKIGFGVKCSCENSFILNLSSDSFKIDIRFNDSNLVEQSEIVINDEWMDYSEQVDNLTINGKAYTDLIIYKNTNQTPSKRFDRIILSKTIGIVAIIGEKDEWKIIDNTVRKIEISDIEFKSTDC